MSIFGISISDIVGAKIFIPLLILLAVSAASNYVLYKSVGYYRGLYFQEQEAREKAEEISGAFENRAIKAEADCNEVKKYYENLPKPKTTPGDIAPDDVDSYMHGGVQRPKTKPDNGASDRPR